MSKELNHFGVFADLFRQIGGHSTGFVLFCSFWRLFTKKMIKSVKVFPFSFWKIMTFFFYFIKFKPPAYTCKMAAKWFNSLDTNSKLGALGSFSVSGFCSLHPITKIFFSWEFIRNYLAQSLFTINLILAVIFVKIGTLQIIMALVVE